MTYEEALAYKEEAEKLRAEIYDRGLLKVYVDPIPVRHDWTRAQIANEVVGLIESGERNWEPSLLRIECSVCEKNVCPGHNCIAGPITKKQLKELRGELRKGGQR